MGMPPVRRAFFILFIAAGVVAVFLLLAQDQITLKTRSAVGAAEPRHANYLAGLLGVDLTRGNRYRVLTNGDQIFPAMLNAVRGAKRRISFESYIFKAGDMAEQFTKAFEDAARRGVRVQLVIDAVGGSGIDDETVKRLENAGCRLEKFNTPQWYTLEELNYRTHRKILVVDGEIAFTGGAGIDDQWKGNAQDKEHWRDTMVEIVGPLARLIEGGFYENFAEAGGEVTPELDDVVQERDAEGASFVVRSSPTGGGNDLKRLYLLGLASARQTVDITTPYFVTDESSRWALARCSQARRQDPPGPRRRHHRRDAGEVRLAEALRAADGARDRDLRVSADDDAHQDVRRGRHLEHVRLGELRQSLARAERRVERRGDAAATLPPGCWPTSSRTSRPRKRLDLATWRQRSLLMKVREQFWASFGEIF